MNLHPIFGAILARFQGESEDVVAGTSPLRSVVLGDALRPLSSDVALTDATSSSPEHPDADAPIYGEPDDAAIDAMLEELNRRMGGCE